MKYNIKSCACGCKLFFIKRDENQIYCHPSHGIKGRHGRRGHGKHSQKLYDSCAAPYCRIKTRNKYCSRRCREDNKAFNVCLHCDKLFNDGYGHFCFEHRQKYIRDLAKVKASCEKYDFEFRNQIEGVVKTYWEVFNGSHDVASYDFPYEYGWQILQLYRDEKETILILNSHHAYVTAVIRNALRRANSDINITISRGTNNTYLRPDYWGNIT